MSTVNTNAIRQGSTVQRTNNEDYYWQDSQFLVLESVQRRPKRFFRLEPQKAQEDREEDCLHGQQQVKSAQHCPIKVDGQVIPLEQWHDAEN